MYFVSQLQSVVNELQVKMYIECTVVGYLVSRVCYLVATEPQVHISPFPF